MDSINKQQAAQTAHRKMQASTTLNRKYVQRPTASTATMPQMGAKAQQQTMNTMRQQQQVMQQRQAAQIQMRAAQYQSRMQQPTTQPQRQTTAMAQPKAHPMQAAANAQLRARAMQQQAMQQQQANRPTAAQLKEQAIQSALTTAAKTPTSEEKGKKFHFGIGRIALALGCTAAAIFAIVYFVNLNMPDLSLRVAAMQTGIEAKYPSYIPRDYNLSNIASEDGKITLIFNNSSTSESFILTEEKSSWDSNALLSGFVKTEYSSEYSTIREQGLTIYIDSSNAAWVNGGIVYKISATSGTLTKKQIRSIAVSL